jgi:hypothetical protein
VEKDVAVAEALGFAHATLLEDLRKLAQAARPGSAEGLPELCARLAVTQAHLLEHFRFEEHNGYMDAVRKREPRLERAVQDLAEEHGQLARSLAELLGRAGATSPDDGVRQAVLDWVERVRRHEGRESALVQEAFGTDIGAED